MTTGRWLVIWLLATMLPVFATTILPTKVSSSKSGDGATDQWKINCLFKTSGDPQLIQCYVTVKSPAEVTVSLHLTLKKAGETVAGVPVKGFFKSDRGNGHVFNFALNPDLLAESHIDIYTDKGSFRIQTGQVEIVDGRAAPDAQ